MIDQIEIIPAVCELTRDGKSVKTVKGIDYPYYINNLEDNHLTNLSIITLTFVNTSEAFARLRFDNAIIKQPDNTIANYNISTFGAHKNHIMLKKESSGKIGLLIGNESLARLKGAKITISTYLDNNFNNCYLDEQSYQIMGVYEETVTFMPNSIVENSFKQLR